MSVEEELRREQKKMSETLMHKQRVIETQEHRIADLDATNMRLLSALNELSDRYQGSSTNTNTNRRNLNTNHRLLEEFGELKSSSC